MNTNETYTIKQLSEKFDMSTVYIRRSIKNGKLNAVLKNISENVKRYEIAESDFIDFRNNVSKSKRTDGRNKFNIYLTKNEHQMLNDLFDQHDLSEIKSLLQRSNQKSKPKQ